MSTKPKTRRRYIKLSVDEVSGVDVPAQSPALVAYTKRAPIAKLVDTAKRATLTSAESGHSHLVFGVDEMQAGVTDGAYMTLGADGYGSGYHSHPWAKGTDGSITIGMALGHTHELLDNADLSEAEADVDTEKRGAPAPTAKPPTLPAPPAAAIPTNTTKQETPAMMTEEEKAELARAKALATMTDAQKRYHARLATAEQVTFEKASPADRQALLDADKVVFVAKHGAMAGREFRASESQSDSYLFAKTIDTEVEKRLEAEARAKRVTLEKRAETEIAGLGGTLEERADLLAVIDAGVAALGIQTEKAARFAEIVKGASAAATQLAGPIGSPTTPAKAATAQAAFDAKVVEFAKANKIGIPQATGLFMQTDEGAALYEAIQAETYGANN